MRFSFRKRSPPDQALIAEYKSYCERCARAIASTGRDVKPYLDSGVPRFLASRGPNEIFERLRIYTEVLEEMVGAGDSLDDSKRLLWRMLSRLGLTPPSDLMSHIEDGDVIEIYTASEDLQLFRNLLFFDLLHLSIDELSTLVWHRDSKRSMKITAEGFRLLFMIRSGCCARLFRFAPCPPIRLLAISEVAAAKRWRSR